MPQKLWKYIPSIPDEIEIPDKSIIELFRETASNFQDLPLTYFEGKYKTYKEVVDDINRLANGLRELGIKKGDRVAAFLPNSPQFIVTFLAVHSLGAIFTGISSLSSQKELQYQLEDSGAKAIVTFDVFLDKVREVKDETSLEHIIVTSAADELPSIKAFLYKLIIGRKNPKVKNEIKYKELLKKSSNEPIITKVDPKDDIAVLQYTGGTTGVMKGAMLTHKNLVAQAITLDYWKNWLDNVPEKPYRIVGALPFSHIFGLSTSLLWPAIAGATIYLFPDPRKLEAIIKSIDKFKIQFFMGIPVMFLKISEHPKVDKYDLSSLLMCISGGESLPKVTVDKFESKTGNVLVEGYGLTESSPVTHVNPANRKYRKIGTIGIPIPNVKAMIVDTDTLEEITEFGKPGELWIRGPSVMKGYWNNKEATEKSLVKGWLRTGDIAVMDEEGFFAIVDRIKDMIIVSGYKVWPNEVEDVLYSHPAINMAAVIGEKAETKEIVKAYLVKEPGHEELSLEEVRAYCKKHLAPYKVPRKIEYLEELPRTALGKVLRKELRALSAVTSAQSLPKETIEKLAK
ncbi:MAG: long-chain-fatty-acid--CoA ligase [Candidatus Heimdallarchaeaceae archaeon]